MRKLFVFITICFMAFGVTAYAANTNTDVRYISDGYITMEESFPFDKTGSKITVVVIKDGILLTEENDFLKMAPDDVVYYEVFALSEEKKADICIKLEQSGVYQFYTFSKAKGTTVKKLSYIKNTAIDAIQGSNSAVEIQTVLEGNIPEDLGIFGMDVLYGTTDKEKLSLVIEESLQGISNATRENVVKIIGDSLVAELLNEGNLNSFYAYPNLPILENPIFTFITKNNESQVIQGVSASQLTSVGALNDKLIEETALALANGNQAATLKLFLEQYQSELGISQSVTSQLCSAITTKGGFTDIQGLLLFITQYTLPQTNGSSGGSGGGGGGGISLGTNNAYNGATAVTPETEDDRETQEIDVFDDIADVAWAKDAITALYKKNVINGKEERKFAPYDEVTREEFAKILISAFNMKLVDAEAPFTDVQENDWSYEYIRTAYLAGVVKGMSDNYFGKTEKITRQDLAVMVYRMLALVNCTEQSDDGFQSFADGETIAEYAKAAVGSLYRQGIVSGDDARYFHPEDNASRAEAAKIVHHALKIYESSR